MAFVVGLLALVTGEKNSDIAPRKEIQILESGKVLLVESRISRGNQNPRLWNPEYSTRNLDLTKYWILESKVH